MHDTDEMKPDWGARVDELRRQFNEAGPQPPAADGDVEMLAEAHERRWRHAIPARFHQAHVDQLAGHLAALADWDGHANVVILGNVGAGKTHAAVALARTAHDDGRSIMFRPAVRLLDELRPGGDPDALDRAVSADVLVLDDLGSERPTDWTAERLYIVVSSRYDEMRPTIVTSNLDAGPLETGLGARMWSRLSDGAVRVRVADPDRRKARA